MTSRAVGRWNVTIAADLRRTAHAIATFQMRGKGADFESVSLGNADTEERRIGADGFEHTFAEFRDRHGTAAISEWDIAGPISGVPASESAQLEPNHAACSNDDIAAIFGA